MMLRSKSTSDHLQKAQQFRDLMSQPMGVMTREIANLQGGLIEEETQEFVEAIQEAIAYPQNKRAKEEALKELADLTYVCFQAAAAFGWDLNEALDRVHRSNLSKLVDGKPLRREDGKVLKGPNYKKPTLTDLV